MRENRARTERDGTAGEEEVEEPADAALRVRLSETEWTTRAARGLGASRQRAGDVTQLRARAGHQSRADIPDDDQDQSSSKQQLVLDDRLRRRRGSSSGLD